jgi:hypothetical protein
VKSRIAREIYIAISNTAYVDEVVGDARFRRDQVGKADMASIRMTSPSDWISKALSASAAPVGRSRRCAVFIWIDGRVLTTLDAGDTSAMGQGLPSRMR